MRGVSETAVVFLFSISTFGLVYGNHVSGRIECDRKLVLVSKFWFADDVGRLDFKVKYSTTSNCCPSLAYYNDKFNDWESVNQNSDMVCQSKLSYAQGMFSFQNATTGNNNSTDRSYSVQCHTNGDSYLRFCSGTLRVDSVDNGWWSFVLSHCNSTRGLNISYEFNFTDGYFWNADTSTRRVQDIFDSHLISLGGYLVLYMASFYFARHLHRRGMLHPAFKLFMTTLGFKTGAVLFDFIFHTNYVLSGLELSLFTISEALHATSEIILIVLLILLVFGWTITKARLNESIQTKLNMFFSSYTVIFGILFVLEQRLFVPEVLQIARLGNAVLRSLAWVLFVYGTISTIRENPAKQQFYLSLMVFFSVWFLTKPVASLVSAFSSEGWLITLRFHRLEPILCFIGFGCLLSIMGPKNFPFHTRTNGVGPPQVQNPPVTFNETTGWNEGNRTFGTQPTY